MGNLGLFECEWMPFGLCNTPSTFQRLLQNCLGELSLTYCLLGWCDWLFKNGRGTLTMLAHCVWVFQGIQSEVQAHQVWILLEWDQLFGSSCLQGRCTTQQREPESCGWIHSTPYLHWNLRLFGLSGILPQIYEGFCMHCVTTTQKFICRRCQQEA